VKAPDLHRGGPTPAFLIPIKAFNLAKGRLAESLSSADRRDLANYLALCVFGSCDQTANYVVCDDEDVSDWAFMIGSTPLWTPADGLNDAVTKGRARITELGHDRVIVIHSDLPLVVDTNWLARFPADRCVIVPDRHRQGTNALVVPSGTDFTFQYGPGSFHKHIAEAAQRNLPISIVEDEAVGWDLDTPDDLIAPNGENFLGLIETYRLWQADREQR
jgi:2-phospho-L-lactate guanylyltransferase